MCQHRFQVRLIDHNCREHRAAAVGERNIPTMGMPVADTFNHGHHPHKSPSMSQQYTLLLGAASGSWKEISHISREISATPAGGDCKE